MRIEAVVLNASPLITLFRSGQADLLPRLFNRIVVPEVVWQESLRRLHCPPGTRSSAMREPPRSGPCLRKVVLRDPFTPQHTREAEPMPFRLPVDFFLDRCDETRLRTSGADSPHA